LILKVCGDLLLGEPDAAGDAGEAEPAALALAFYGLGRAAERGGDVLIGQQLRQ
jgi:hypothetical protein